MRAMPIVLILFSLFAISPVFADDACRCQGCGCKGGAGWRGPDGALRAEGLAYANLRIACGSAVQAGGRQAHLLRQAIGAGLAEAENASAITLGERFRPAEPINGAGGTILRI